jgi:RHS repeat-associated protein
MGNIFPLNKKLKTQEMLPLKRDMGCKKLTYYDGDRSLGASGFFLKVLRGKKGAQQKNGLDYYPFGSVMPGRSFSSDNYRYGFNGQEKTDEISGVGNHNTALFWEYDTRLARRWNLDPKPNPELSHYSVFAGNPIMFNDPLGDTIRLSKELQNSEGGLATFNQWKVSRAGKRIYKKYDIGGKHENVSIVFGIVKDEANGGTEAFAVNNKTGAETRLMPERSLPSLKSDGYDISKFRTAPKKGEFLRFKVGIPESHQYDDKVVEKGWQVRHGLTVLHETQHIKIMHSDIIKYGRIYYSGAEQHLFMKDKSLQWYQERFDYYREKYPNRNGDEIDKTINSFEYGRY